MNSVLQKACNQMQGKPTPSTGKSLKSETQHSLPPIERISQAKMNDKCAKGLCCYFDEMYVLGHQCKGVRFIGRMESRKQRRIG